MAKFVLPSAWLLIWGVAGCDASLDAYVPPKGGDTDATDAPTDTVVDGDDDDDTTSSSTTETTETTEPVDIDLDGVTPWYGTVDQEVTLFGGPFPADVDVQFGGESAVVLDNQGDRLTLAVPDLGDDAVVEITATAATGSSPAPLDFQYFEDGTGKYGALGTVDWYDYRGGYWDAATVDTGYAQVMLSVPTVNSYAQVSFAGVRDTCERDWSLGVTTYIYDPGVGSITLRDGANQLVLPSVVDQPYIYYGTDLQVQPGNTYDLSPITANPLWPDFGVPQISGTVPSAMVVTSPNIDNGSFPTTPSSITVNWAGPYDGDAVLVRMQRMRWDGNTFQPLERVSCWLTDDGSHIVPASSWAAWDTSNDYVYMAVGRAYQPQNVILPHNNAQSDVMGVYWSIGFLDAN
ncbi:MAG: hypothetical protein R3F59_18630 [Myxococcota bacterium]